MSTHRHMHIYMSPHCDLDCTDSKTIFYMTFWLKLICHVHTKFSYKRLNHKPLESFVNETTHGPKVSQMTKIRLAFICSTLHENIMLKAVTLVINVCPLSPVLYFQWCMHESALWMMWTASSLCLCLNLNGSHICSSHATVPYSREYAISMVIDDQLPNILAADGDSGSVWDFLCCFIMSEL